MKQLGGAGGTMPTGIPGITTGGMIGSGNSQQTVMQRGASPQGKNTFAQTILENKQLLSNTASLGRDALRVMSESLKRSVDSQKRDLTDLERTIQRLTRTYDDLKNSQASAAAAGVNPAGYEGQLDSAAANLGEAVSSKQKGEKKLEDLLGQQKAFLSQGGGGGAPPGSGGAPPGVPPSRWAQMSSDDRARAFGAGVKVVGNTVSSFANIAQNSKTMEAINGARSADMGRFLLNSAMSGNAYPFFIMNHAMAGGGNVRDRLGNAGDTGARQAGMFGEGAGMVGDIVLGAMAAKGGLGGVGGKGGGGGRMADISNVTSGVGAMGGGLAGIGGLMQQSIYGGPQAEAAQTQMTYMRAVMEQNPVYEGMFSSLQQMASGRVAAAKSLQGNHMRAWGIGMGHGLDFGESAGVANSLVRQFGMGGVFGGGGGSRSVTDRVRMKSLAAEAMGYGYGNGNLSMVRGTAAADTIHASALAQAAAAQNDQTNMLHGAGFAQSGSDPYLYSRTRQVRGARSMGLMEGTLQLEQMGMDRGASGMMLGTMATATGGSRQAAPEAAMKRLEDAMAKAMKRGIEDARLFEEIGSAVAEASITRTGGKNTGTEFGRMLSAGLDGNSSLFDVQANVRGVQGYNQFAQSNPYTQAVRARAARSVLGPGGSGLAMTMVQRSDLSDLLQGSDTLRSLGVSDKQSRAIIDAELNVVAGSHAQRGGRLQQALVRNKGSFESAMAEAVRRKDTGTQTEAAASLYAAGYSPDISAAKSLVNEIASLGGAFGGNGTAGRNKYKGHHDGMAEQTIALSQSTLAALAANEQKIIDGFKQAVSDAMKTPDQMNGMPAGIESGQYVTVQIIGPAKKPGMLDRLFGSSKNEKPAKK